MKRSILHSLRARIRPACDTVTLDRDSKLRLSGKAIRLPVTGNPEFRIMMGTQVLHLCPDPGIVASAEAQPCDYILFDPDRYFSRIAHQLRIAPGQTLTIDSNIDFQRHVFTHPREAFRRHVSIAHEGDALVIRDTISELGTWISLLAGNPETSSITQRRLAALKRIPEIFGGPLIPLPGRQALALLERVNELLRHQSAQHPDSMGNPGGLVELPGHITPVIVGDLHARIDNLVKVLCENTFLDSLEQGTAALIILGDAVHQDPPGQLEEMESSLLMMDLIFSLKVKYPEQVFYLIGNHDSFQHELMKRGIPQGLLWDKHIVAARGHAYREQLELFYRQSPLLVLSPYFIACHAGPPRKAVSRETLVEVHQFPEIMHDLTWGRIKTAACPGGYTGGNVKQLRKGLQAGRETPLIVGHHPFTQDGTLWLNVARTRQHHIVISSRTDRVGMFTCIDGAMVPQVYPAEPLLDWLNRAAASAHQ